MLTTSEISHYTELNESKNKEQEQDKTRPPLFCFLTPFVPLLLCPVFMLCHPTLCFCAMHVFIIFLSCPDLLLCSYFHLGFFTYIFTCLKYCCTSTAVNAKHLQTKRFYCSE